MIQTINDAIYRHVQNTGKKAEGIVMSWDTWEKLYNSTKFKGLNENQPTYINIPVYRTKDINPKTEFIIF